MLTTPPLVIDHAHNSSQAILDNLDKDPATDSFEDDLDETEDVTKEFEPYHKGTDIEGQ